MSNLPYNKVRVYKRTKTGWNMDTPIDLTDVFDIKVTVGTGKKKDDFGFDVVNANGRAFQTFHSGDGSTDTFAWEYGSIPIDTQDEFKVYVGGVLKTLDYDYLYLDDSIVFSAGSIPPDGTRNIRLDFPVVDQEDLVQVYIKTSDNSFTTADIALEGFVENVDRIERDSDISLSVSGSGAIEALFGVLAFALSFDSDLDTTKKTPKQIIEQIISQINSLISTRQIIWNPTNDDPTGTITYTSKYKRAIEIIEDIASEPVNGDGYYYYSVSKDTSTNNQYFFNFTRKSIATGSDIDIVEGGTNNPIDITTTYNSEVINAVVYNCGRAPNDSPMEFLYYNREKGISGSIKWKYITSTASLGSLILDNEFKASSASFDQTTDGNRKSNFPNGYPYTLAFDIVNRKGVATGSRSVSNDDDFNDAVKNYAKKQGSEIIKKIVDRGNSRRQVKIIKQFSSVNEIPLGTLLSVTSAKNGYDSVLLRVTELKYTPLLLKITALEDETIV